MPDQYLRTSVASLERALLQAICGQTLNRKIWEDVQRELSCYKWREPDHAVVYETIVKARNRGAADWRSHLPAQATRMGFPDLDWEIYFGETGKPKRKIIELVRAMKSSVERSS